MDEQLVAFAKSAIREYLAARPDSADTLDGIHRWWIRWPGLAESPVITQIALEHLHAAGDVEPFRVGNNVLWRRHRDVPAGV